MNIQKSILWGLSLALALTLVESAAGALIPVTAFTYQGRVNDNGVLANGIYDFQFTLYSSSNSPGTIIAGPLTNAATVVSNGLFTVALDFGGDDIFNGSDRWLEIAMRTNGAGGFTILAPRQEMTRTPYAIGAVNALNANVASFVSAVNISGTISSAQLPATVVTNGASGVNISGTFTGNGVGVTNISVYSLAGSSVSILGWGQNDVGQATGPADLGDVMEVACGYNHSLALKRDGTVVAWGGSDSGETNVPAGLNNVVAVAAGAFYSLALKGDGTVAAWGANNDGQTSVPTGLNNVVAVAAGGLHGLALKNNGTVVAWGDNTFGQTNVPAGLTNVVAIAAGELHSLVLKRDGTVVVWGANNRNQTNVPPGLNNVMAVAAGLEHCLVLKSNGTMVAWGYNAYGQTNIPGGLSNVVAIAAGAIHNLVLKSDGTVVVWGDNTYGQTSVPGGLNSIVALNAGCESYYSLAVQKISSVALRNQYNTFIGDQTFIGNGTILGDQKITGNQTITGNQVIQNNQTVFGNATIAGSQTVTNNQAILGNQTISGNVTIGLADPQAPLQIGADAAGDGWIIGHNTAVGGYTALIGGISALQNGYGYFQGVRASGSAIGNIILNPGGGNVGIANTNPANLFVVGGSASPAYCNGTTWVNGSDRNAKEDFAVVNPSAVLEKVSALPITEWKYKVEADDARHIGPMAQDFHAAFGLNGPDDKHIATVDESGVALAAIQGLNQKVRTLESENAELKARLEALEKIMLEQKSHRAGAQ